MQMHDLFQLAVGLEKPWTVTRLEFSVENKQLDLWVDFPAGSTFACPECGRADCGVYDTRERTWRHLNFFEHKAFVHAREPRVRCPRDGVKTIEVPWARSHVGFTRLMEAYIVMLLQNGMTAKQVARMVDEHDTKIWRVLQHYVDEGRSRADFSGVQAIGVDETSRKRGHHYISVFMDLDESRVLFVTVGKDADTVQEFRKDLEAHGGAAEKIQEACLDMSAGYIRGLKDNFPDTPLTFDSFHLVKLINEAVDEVRRQEQPTQPELKGTRYVWLKNEWNHTKKQAALFDTLRSSKLKTVRAHHLKSVFQDIFACESRKDAEPLLRQWYYWATHSRLKPMIKAAKTIKEHWEGVLRWFTSRVSNGILEAINGLIQSAKRKARGFRSISYLTTMVYLIAGKFDLGLPVLANVSHTK